MATQSAQQRLWSYAPVVVWMGFIFFASTGEFSASNTSRIIRPLLLWLFPNISEERIALAHFLTRKSAHFTEYAILGLLAARAFTRSSQQLLQRAWFQAATLLIVFYALADEYHQTFVPSRTGSIYDSAVDIAGGLTALIVFAYLFHRAERWAPGKFEKP
ncbi:MAG: VanZ family protein [Acidobacteriota bacterium]